MELDLPESKDRLTYDELLQRESPEASPPVRPDNLPRRRSEPPVTNRHQATETKVEPRSFAGIEQRRPQALAVDAKPTAQWPQEGRGQLMNTEPIMKLPALPAVAKASATTTETPAVGKRLIRLADLFALLDVGRATGHRLIASGKIGPCAIRLTPATVRFDAEEVDTWLSTRRPDGNLYDAKSWPAVWERIQRKRS